MARFSKTWRCPGAVAPRRNEGLKDWALRDIEWACKLGKSVDDDDKCIAWLKEKKNINASKVRGNEGWIYDFGNHFIRYWLGQHWHFRNAGEGDFFVVFTNGTFALMSKGQFQMLDEKIKIRKLDERLKATANPFGINKTDMRAMATTRPYNELHPDPNEGD